ncbi:unnamed protein product [Spodoptera exigua]|nr:unnamed protein product [Spodoptera exigua]CAH0703318.1 unnamed protein product [Spodoptera exigua]CAH0703320.1 unnamed protein product [Spodoptera exigua]CAH0703322.1 unnamed protein product [Spodoptera exigua]
MLFASTRIRNITKSAPLHNQMRKLHKQSAALRRFHCSSTGQSRAKKCEMCESTEIREELLKRKVESHKQKVEELNKKKIGFCVRRMQEYHQLLPHSSSRQQLYGGSTAQHWSVSRKEVRNVRKYRNQKMPGSNGLNIMPEKENGLMATPNFMTFLAKMLLNAESVVPPDAS